MCLALETTCKLLAELIRGDDQMVTQIVEACQREAAAAQRPDPERLRQLKTQTDKISKTIGFNRRNPGVTTEEQEAVAVLIRQLGIEHAELMSKIAFAEAAQRREITVPTEQAVRALLDGLSDILIAPRNRLQKRNKGGLAKLFACSPAAGSICISAVNEKRNEGGWKVGSPCGC